MLLSTSKWLGELSFLRIWHDNSGEGRFKSWQLDRVVVTELPSGTRYTSTTPLTQLLVR